jgi:hypothetical protein
MEPALHHVQGNQDERLRLPSPQTPRPPGASPRHIKSPISKDLGENGRQLVEEKFKVEKHILAVETTYELLLKSKTMKESNEEKRRR